MDCSVKVEIQDGRSPPEKPSGVAAKPQRALPPEVVIELSSSESESDEEEEAGDASGLVKRSRDSDGGFLKERVRKKSKSDGGALPLGFLDPLPPVELTTPPQRPPLPPMETSRPASGLAVAIKANKQFWKAGDYEGSPCVDPSPVSGGMDRVRVHPKFLHSNATSHKWALGALAELLDNALDEVCNGATYVNIDMLESRKDGTRMLLVEDDGGGMDPEKMRHCMSLGYSVKSKIANNIGQYGNGFKTSTMRLGADVIVFSRCRGKQGRSDTQSIGMMSYTFLRSTGKEDIVVPMLDYEKKGHGWKKLTSTLIDWDKNLETIIQWSPYSSEADLLQQFSMRDQGTRIVIYNLWENDQGKLELDFDGNRHDIQLTGVNRDESKIQMAEKYPNSRHFLTYRHSLRSYASILYLRLPRGFRMILRGKEIEHHNIVNDMMMKHEVTYRPQPIADGVPKDPNMVAVVTMGFVKDAKEHIDVQGFNVYYKNRLIKPFWRVWNPAGSDGRGVIGVLEANFVAPAHDKQDFERTIVLSRLEARLVEMQKKYWGTNCHKIGYAPRRTKKIDSDKESSPEVPQSSSRHSGKVASPRSISPRMSKSQDNTRHCRIDKSISNSNPKMGKSGVSVVESAKAGVKKSGGMNKFERGRSSPQRRSNKTYTSEESNSDTEFQAAELSKRSSDLRAPHSQNSSQKENAGPSLSSSPCSVQKGTAGSHALNERVAANRITTRSQSKTNNTVHDVDMADVECNGNGHAYEESSLSIKQLKDENEALKERLKKAEESMLQELQEERDKNKLLAEQLKEMEKKLEETSKEQEALIDIFSEERTRRDKEEENLRKKIKDASVTIEELREQLSSCRSNTEH